MWWGYSSALDLLDDENFCGDKDDLEDRTDTDQITLNALLVGQSDNRHVLKTLSKKHLHSNIQINFYVYESLLENVARDLLFLVLALEPSENVGLAEKTKFFMELYGNTLIRPATSNYLSNTAQHLLSMITDFTYAAKVLPMVSFDKLKYRERDQLETIFKYWSSKEVSFDILTSWNQKLRKSLGLRYDSKAGVFDWDYHMRYKSFGADCLHLQEYKRFREMGMSFYAEDSDPCIANRTLASAIISSGLKMVNFGYLGDIVTGPYPAFGFKCNDPKMLEKVNGYYKKTATDVTEHNIMSIFYELINSKTFHASHNDDATYATIIQDTSHKLKISLPDESSGDGTLRQHQQKIDRRSLLTVDQSQIIFLPTSALDDFSNRSIYENFFDIITFPQIMVKKYLTPDFMKILKPYGKLIVDTPKYLLSYRQEDLYKYKCDLENLMKESNCINLNPSFSYVTDEFMRFQVSKQKSITK